MRLFSVAICLFVLGGALTAPAAGSDAVPADKKLYAVVVSEAGRVVWKNSSFARGAEGVSAGSETDDHVTFEIGGGSYSFTLAGRARG